VGFAAIELLSAILLMEFCAPEMAEIFYTSLSADFTIEFLAIKIYNKPRVITLRETCNADS